MHPSISLVRGLPLLLMMMRSGLAQSSTNVPTVLIPAGDAAYKCTMGSVTCFEFCLLAGFASGFAILLFCCSFMPCSTVCGSLKEEEEEEDADETASAESDCGAPKGGKADPETLPIFRSHSSTRGPAGREDGASALTEGNATPPEGEDVVYCPTESNGGGKSPQAFGIAIPTPNMTRPVPTTTTTTAEPMTAPAVEARVVGENLGQLDYPVAPLSLVTATDTEVACAMRLMGRGL